jgi:pheromone shutdown protein TraB
MAARRLPRAGIAVAVAAAGCAATIPLPEVALPRERRVELQLALPTGRVRLTLLGVSHTSDASTAEARSVVDGALARGALAAVALESDDETLGLQRAAHMATAGFSPAAIRADGVAAVQRAVFEQPSVRARLAGLERPEQIRLSTEMQRGLARGHLFGREMAVAAEAAEQAGVPVVCVDLTLEEKARRYGDATRADAPTPAHALAAQLGQAVELRWRALAHGGVLRLDDQLAAMRRFSPASYRAQVDERDVEMAGRVRSLCAALAPHDDAEVVVVCGAAHLAGLQARLADDELSQTTTPDDLGQSR